MTSLNKQVNLSTTMLTFTLPLFSFLVLFSTTAAQPYKPTDYFLLNCGGATATSERKWDTDELSKFVPSSTTTTSFTSTPNNRDPSVPEIPYSTARIFNTSSFTYTFPVTDGPKYVRLYFYPATYSNHNANQSFFSVSSNGYSLLSNFSAFLTASYVGTSLGGSPPVPHFIKEFIIYVNDTQSLNVTFTPSPNSYAFINGIEIVSLPENLYHKSKSLKYIGQHSGLVIAENTGLENIYRLNVGGGQIAPTADTGMYRSWDQDDRYVFPVSAIGLTPVNQTPIVYTADTPSYTAPELVYATQRSMGNLSRHYNLTWLLPVDSGFYYKLRLHFCNIIPQYTKQGEVVFTIFINNQTAEDQADVFYWSGGTGLPVFKDYVVFVYDFDGSGRKQDLWLAMGPNSKAADVYGDAFLNGLEVFKISMAGNLAGPNPELSPTPPPPPPPSIKENKKTLPYAAIFGGTGSALLLFSALGFIVFRQRRVKHSGATNEKPYSSEQKSKDSGLPSDRCRRFTIKEVKDATGEFDENCIIGKGGFVLCARPVIINRGLPDDEVNLAEWGRVNYQKGTLNEIVDKRISDEIAPNCLLKFGEVANRCIRIKGSKRPKMDEVVWGLEFALQLQESAEKTGGVAGELTGGVWGSAQEFLYPMQGETSITEASTGAAIRHDMSSTDSSRGGFESDTCFTQTSDVSKETSTEGR
ncbi:unnamed protein product [Lactuca virosa]|uniref:Malectin-like domain-containing protein n=1 Tax=Lactuca virosa TaxID=75947 RepID=A0AAU9MSU5_9ASTR|nr:unnamed protein product [Lactuca virosa]